MNLTARFEVWLAQSWWPPGFLQRGFNWRLPFGAAALFAIGVGYFAGGANSIWVTLFSLNATIYIGIPFVFTLLLFWKSRTESGSRISYELICVLLLLAALLPANLIGGLFARKNIEKAKLAGFLLAGELENFQKQTGRLPSDLSELSARGTVPPSPLPVEYRLDSTESLFELRIADPTCMFSCFWVFKPEHRQWYFVGS